MRYVSHGGFFKRRVQGVFYFGCMFPLTFISLSIMIGITALRRTFSIKRIA